MKMWASRNLSKQWQVRWLGREKYDFFLSNILSLLAFALELFSLQKLKKTAKASASVVTFSYRHVYSLEGESKYYPVEVFSGYHDKKHCQGGLHSKHLCSHSCGILKTMFRCQKAQFLIYTQSPFWCVLAWPFFGVTAEWKVISLPLLKKLLDYWIISPNLWSHLTTS